MSYILFSLRQDLSKVGYAHFSNGKSVLYSNSIEDDRRAMYEAGLQSVTAEGGAGGTGTTDSTKAM
eukprot:gene6235-12626_t